MHQSEIQFDILNKTGCHKFVNYVFMITCEVIFRVSVIFASELLKRNTDSVRCAMENDVFNSLPDETLLDELEVEN